MQLVALPAEGVDRNIICKERTYYREVALPAEGVDRNLLLLRRLASGRVALPAEGVDRNYIVREVLCLRRKSPSPRRAWIEIARHPVCSGNRCRPPRGGRG